jgi:hypothetical protein
MMSTHSKIVLDKSRPFSTIHGTRTPEDPWCRVFFVQDDLPFDGEGNLAPDDGKEDHWDVVIDNQRIRYHPLWDATKRKILAKKVTRLEKHAVAEDEEDFVDAESTRLEQEKVVDDVNLVLWLRGEAKYQPWQIFAATRKRIGVNCHTTAAAVEALVLDSRLIPESELSPQLKKLVPLLNQA